MAAFGVHQGQKPKAAAIAMKMSTAAYGARSDSNLTPSITYVPGARRSEHQRDWLAALVMDGRPEQ